MVTNCNLLAKPSNGAVALADVREPTLAILCEPCGGRGCYNVKRLIAERGTDAKLPDLFVTLADCDKARSLSILDRCALATSDTTDGGPTPAGCSWGRGRDCPAEFGAKPLFETYNDQTSGDP